MKVKDIIAELQCLDQDAEVWAYSSIAGEFRPMEDTGLPTSTSKSKLSEARGKYKHSGVEYFYWVDEFTITECSKEVWQDHLTGKEVEVYVWITE